MIQKYTNSFNGHNKRHCDHDQAQVRVSQWVKPDLSKAHIMTAV